MNRFLPLSFGPSSRYLISKSLPIVRFSNLRMYAKIIRKLANEEEQTNYPSTNKTKEYPDPNRLLTKIMTGGIDAGRKFFERTTEKNIILYNTMLDYMSTNGSLKDLVFYYKRMISSNVTPDVNTLNAMVNGYFRQKEFGNGVEIMEEIVRRGITPNTQTMAIMIRGYGKVVDNLEEAENVCMKVMPKYCIEPDDEIASALLSVYISLRLEYKAVQFFNSLPKALKGAKTYTEMIRYYVNNKDIKNVEDIYAQMNKVSIVPESRTLSLMLLAYLDAKDIDKVKLFYSKLRDIDSKQCVKYMNSLLRQFLYRGNTTTIMFLFDLMVDKNITTYNYIMKAYIKKSQIVKAEDLLGQMVHIGVQPNIDTISTLLFGYAKISDMDKVKELLSKMKQLYGVKLDHNAMNSVIKDLYHAAKYQEAEKLLREIISKYGFLPDESTAEAIKSSAINDPGRVTRIERELRMSYGIELFKYQ